MNKQVRRLSLFSILALVTTVGSASFPSPVLAQAQVVTSSTSIPFDAVVMPACTGTVTLKGSMHVLSHVTNTKDKDGNVTGTNIQAHFNSQGITGVGSDGTQYVSNQTSHVSFESGLVLPTTTTQVVKMLLIAKGQDPDLRTRLTMHFTLNANGDLTVSHGSSEVDCR